MKQPAPKIEFPCRYSLRVIGQSSENFHQEVIEIVKKHAPELDSSEVTVKPSSKGNFSSVFLVIKATGEPQLAAIHESLKKHPAVKMVI